MNTIEIIINNVKKETNIVINCKTNKIIINDKVKTVSEKQIDDLLRIIRTWKPIYINNKYLDAESFIIKINDNNYTDIIKGKGEYPDNYKSLKEWVGEFDERNNI